MHQSDDLKKHIKDLPVFPLPQIVFFPHSRLPLHIFEPRYRELIQHAREDDLPIMMGHLPSERTLDEHGRPHFLAVGGVGFMERCEELPDGRFLIELAGLSRVKVVQEHDPAFLYRRAEVEILESFSTNETAEEDNIQVMQMVVAGLRALNPKVAEYLSKLIQESRSSSALSDALAAAIVSDPEERQRLIEELDVTKRIESVTHRLSELLAIASQPDGSNIN